MHYIWWCRNVLYHCVGYGGVCSCGEIEGCHGRHRGTDLCHQRPTEAWVSLLDLHLFALFIYFLTSLRIGPFHSRLDVVKPCFSFLIFISCCNNCYRCMITLVVLNLVFRYLPRYRQGRPAPKWHILCWVRCKISTQLVVYELELAIIWAQGTMY